MNRTWVPVFFIIGAALLGGCGKASKNGTSDVGDATGAAGTPASIESLIPTKAQPKLATIKLWIGPEEMSTEMGVTEVQERTGMMVRTKLAEDRGMDFVFSIPP